MTSVRESGSRRSGIWNRASGIRNRRSGIRNSCPAAAQPREGSDELVDQVLEHLLAAAGILGGVALGEDIRFEVAEARLAAFDTPPQLAFPASVAVLDEGSEPAIGHDRAGDLQSSGEAIHAAD